MLHGAGIFTYITGPCLGFYVAKYSSTMVRIWDIVPPPIKNSRVWAISLSIAAVQGDFGGTPSLFFPCPATCGGVHPISSLLTGVYIYIIITIIIITIMMIMIIIIVMIIMIIIIIYNNNNNIYICMYMCVFVCIYLYIYIYIYIYKYLVTPSITGGSLVTLPNSLGWTNPVTIHGFREWTSMQLLHLMRFLSVWNHQEKRPKSW